MMPANQLRRKRNSLKIVKIYKNAEHEQTHLQFYVKTCESPYLGNGTSDHRNEKRRPHCDTKYPPILPRKTHFRNHFWPLESGFSDIAT